MYSKILNIITQLNIVKRFNLKVTLKQDPIKGVGIYATANIKKDDIIAHYKIKVFDSDTYNSPTNSIYVFSILTRSGIVNEKLVGDIDEYSFPQPINNIPFWGPFVNEPSGKQTINAVFNPNLKFNYKLYKRRGIKKGDTLIYSIHAMRDIIPGEEITVYYGDEYKREYEINISDDDKSKCDYKNYKPLKINNLVGIL